ncbi:hypothetical protein ACFCXP_37580 [Streptomyces niveus]|uniref:hypothetical protein n=1 Tax=Streptomyces niveus TaxID=193462 RepID=UPI0035D82F6E
MATVYERSVKGSKKASKELKKGDVVYVVLSIDQSRAPYEDAHLYSAYRITGDHPLLGGAMIGGHSVASLVLNHGPLYTEPPAGLRNVADAGRQVGGPLPKGEEFDRPLSDGEIRDLQRRVDKHDEETRGARRGRWL